LDQACFDASEQLVGALLEDAYSWMRDEILADEFGNVLSRAGPLGTSHAHRAGCRRPDSGDHTVLTATPGLATLTAELVPRVARKHGRSRAVLARLLLAPIGVATRAGDRLVTWFA